MRPPVAVALAVSLLAGAAWTGSLSDRLRASPRPPPGPSAALGGLSSVAAQVLWMRGDAALRTHRVADALYYFRAIEALEPQLVAASAYFADEIGRSIADREPHGERRASLAFLGLDVLDRSVAQNPDLAASHVARGRYLATRIAPDADTATRFAERSGATPFAAARADFEAAVEAEPGNVEAQEGLSWTAFRRAVELFLDALAHEDREAAAMAAALIAESDAASRASYDLVVAQWGADPLSDRELADRLARGERFLEVLRAPEEERARLYARLQTDFGATYGLPPP